MLTESLIRMGRPFLSTGLYGPGEILRQISDIRQARNFFRRVLVVEVHEDKVIALPLQRWGDFDEDVFNPDSRKAVAAPFLVTKGGNPVVAQGFNAVGSYLCYAKNFESFRETPENVGAFLGKRLRNTIGYSISAKAIDKVNKIVHEESQTINMDSGESNLLGLLVLCQVSENGPYQYKGLDHVIIPEQEVEIGNSVLYPDKKIVASLSVILENFWEARFKEGAEKGYHDGDTSCSFCGKKEKVVSLYSKSWPWFATTWSAPISAGMKDSELVDGVAALCEECYQAFTYGSNLFSHLTSPMSKRLTKELFSPTTSVVAKEYKTKSEDIYGGLMLLPLLDHEDQHEFVVGMDGIISKEEHRGVSVHLLNLTGLEMSIPESISSDNYRISLVYFSGDVNKRDIHLRAYIEDVVPSVARELQDLIEEHFDDSVELFDLLISNGKAHDKYLSIPYLISRSFGHVYLWQTLGNVLHKRQLKKGSFTRNSVARFNELAKSLPNLWGLQEEAFFYLYFSDFLKKYNAMLNNVGGEAWMKDWAELVNILSEGNHEKLELESVEDIGFAAGYIMRLFGNRHWAASGKDFMKQRVMTFGSNLTPDTIWRFGLSRIPEYATRLDIYTRDFESQLGIVLNDFARNRTEINKEKYEFMAAFWSGYSLYRPNKKEVIEQ